MFAAAISKAAMTVPEFSMRFLSSLSRKRKRTTSYSKRKRIFPIGRINDFEINRHRFKMNYSNEDLTKSVTYLQLSSRHLA